MRMENSRIVALRFLFLPLGLFCSVFSVISVAKIYSLSKETASSINMMGMSSSMR